MLKNRLCKKIITLFFVVVLTVLSLCGCGKKEVKKTTGVTASEKTVVTSVTEENESINAEEKTTKSHSSSDINESMKNEYESVKAEAKKIEDELDNGVLSQQDMNQKANELYTKWDNLLNKQWGDLKNILTNDEWNKLKKEQVKWVAQKEKSIDKAGSEFAGGTMEPQIIATTGAKITRERVEELMKYFK